MLRHLKNMVLVSAVAASASISGATKAQAYPIDCAILLCLAGGFPASAECRTAKAELIRRITPWPIEPPIKLWRCPLGGGTVSLPGAGGANDVPSEIVQYRDAIEVWEVSKRATNGSGGRDVYVTTIRSSYTQTGRFVREPVQNINLPDWLNDSVREHTGHDLLSEYGGGFRAILLRMKDFTNSYTTEWVRY